MPRNVHRDDCDSCASAHGTVKGYIYHRCRCERCREAYRLYQSGRRAAGKDVSHNHPKFTGRGRPFNKPDAFLETHPEWVAPVLRSRELVSIARGRKYRLVAWRALHRRKPNASV